MFYPDFFMGKNYRLEEKRDDNERRKKIENKIAGVRKKIIKLMLFHDRREKKSYKMTALPLMSFNPLDLNLSFCFNSKVP